MKHMLLGLVVVWFVLMAVYLVSEGIFDGSSLSASAPARVIAHSDTAGTKTWEAELTRLCREVRRARDQMNSTELHEVLGQSACAALIGSDSWTPRIASSAPVTDEPLPMPVAVVPVVQASAEARVIPNVRPAAHMVDTCARMKLKLKDDGLPQDQWRDLLKSYVNVCN